MQIGIRVPRDLEFPLSTHLKQIGKEKTAYLVELIRKDLNMEKSPTLLDRIEDLDRRVASIEAKLNA